MLCFDSNDLYTILNAVFRYVIDFVMTGDVDCACTNRHTDRNLVSLQSNRDFFDKQLIIWGVLLQ